MNRRSQPAHVATILGAALSAVLLSACGGGGGTSEASGKAPAGLLQAGQPSVCTDPEYPPMEYLENGDTANPTGFDSDGVATSPGPPSTSAPSANSSPTASRS